MDRSSIHINRQPVVLGTQQSKNMGGVGGGHHKLTYLTLRYSILILFVLFVN